MRQLLLLSWLLLPIGAWAYHEGPGQDRLAHDAADVLLVAAHRAAIEGDHLLAMQKYDDALAALPRDPEATPKVVIQRLQIERNKARMLAGELPAARQDLQLLVEQFDADPGTDPVIARDARQALARAQFFTTWLMRLEGFDRETWEPEIEAARQNWRYLAEQAQRPDEVARHQADLEAAVRLGRIDLEELQGLPLPGECKCKGSCRGKRPSQRPATGPPKKGAGVGVPFDTGGS